MTHPVVLGDLLEIPFHLKFLLLLDDFLGCFVVMNIFCASKTRGTVLCFPVGRFEMPCYNPCTSAGGEVGRDYVPKSFLVGLVSPLKSTQKPLMFVSYGGGWKLKGNCYKRE